MSKISLKAARVNANLSQGEAAEHVGVATSTLRNWENGITYPDAVQFMTLCNLYGVSCDNIFLK